MQHLSPLRAEFQQWIIDNTATLHHVSHIIHDRRATTSETEPWVHTYFQCVPRNQEIRTFSQLDALWRSIVGTTEIAARVTHLEEGMSRHTWPHLVLDEVVATIRTQTTFTCHVGEFAPADGGFVDGVKTWEKVSTAMHRVTLVLYLNEKVVAPPKALDNDITAIAHDALLLLCGKDVCDM